jgi:uncharacterized protein YjbI with pentapeptide repeats
MASASEVLKPSVSSPEIKEVYAEDLVSSPPGSLIVYDNSRIIGNIILNQAEFKSLKITNSVVDGNISLLGGSFSGKADLRNTSFLKNVSFFGSKFSGEVDFSGSRFYGSTNFSQTIFLEGATFDNNIFDKEADFSASGFKVRYL